MKVKLLKKVRKQYSIVYYPSIKVYEVKHPHDNNMIYTFYDGNTKRTYEEARVLLLQILRTFYHEYTRKHKQSKINYKVWYK